MVFYDLLDMDGIYRDMNVWTTSHHSMDTFVVRKAIKSACFYVGRELQRVLPPKYDLNHVYVTPYTRRWCAIESLRMLFGGYEADSLMTHDVVSHMGVYVISKPMPKPKKPLVNVVSGDIAPGSYAVGLRWKNSSGHSEISDIVEIECLHHFGLRIESLISTINFHGHGALDHVENVEFLVGAGGEYSLAVQHNMPISCFPNHTVKAISMNKMVYDFDGYNDAVQRPDKFFRMDFKENNK